MQLETVVGPLIGMAGTIAAAWIGHRYRQQATRAAEAPPAGQDLIWIPTSAHGHQHDPKRRSPGLWRRMRESGRSVGSLPGAVPAFVRLLWGLMSRIPPAQRRTRPAVAAGVGWLPFAPALYFRTGPDVLVSIAFFALMGVGVDRFPDPAAEEAGATAPTWAYAVFYTAMLFSGLYSYLRSLSSNREIEERRLARAADLPKREGDADVRSADERRQLLERRLDSLASDGWRLVAQSDFEAIVVRTPEVDHRRHARLAAITVGFWLLPWLYSSFLRSEERELFVDRWGTVHVTAPGTRALRPAAG